MKTQPACDLCFQRQAGDAARRSGLSPERSEALLDDVREELSRLPSDVGPPVKASRIHALIMAISGDPDPYRAAKREATRHALGLYLLREFSDFVGACCRQVVSRKGSEIRSAFSAYFQGNAAARLISCFALFAAVSASTFFKL